MPGRFGPTELAAWARCGSGHGHPKPLPPRAQAATSLGPARPGLGRASLDADDLHALADPVGRIGIDTGPFFVAGSASQIPFFSRSNWARPASVSKKIGRPS